MNLKFIVFSIICLFTNLALCFGANNLPDNHNNTQNRVNQSVNPQSTNRREPNSRTQPEQRKVIKKVDPKLQAKLDVKVDDISEEQYQQVVAEYKQYLRTVPSEVRQEIRTYREKMAELNKIKTGLYKKLSQEAQYFLKSESEMKKRLPIKNKAAFSKGLRESNAE